VLIGGTTGTGKSTVASEVAHRLGITRVTSTDFIREVGIASDAGFELGIEMVAKAHRRGLPIAEIPTIWLDRNQGQSNFKVREWIPRYLRWYMAALGRRRQPQRSGYRVHPNAWKGDRDEEESGT